MDERKHRHALELVTEERHRQQGKLDRGEIPWDCAARGPSNADKLTVLTEELGEVARAIIENDHLGMRAEIIQVAAVAVAWLEADTIVITLGEERKMPEHFEIGDHVWANTGGDSWIGHVASGPHENDAGETKYWIQAPDGGNVELGYREPSDRDEHGAGGTFWKV